MFSSKAFSRAARTFSTSSMRADVARMTLVGRVGRAPEQLTSKNGNEYMKYSLVVNTSKTQASWFNILVFDPNLQQFITKHVDKGSLIYLEADATMNKYEAEDGTSRTSLSLIQQTINPITWPKKDNFEETEEVVEESA